MNKTLNAFGIWGVWLAIAVYLAHYLTFAYQVAFPADLSILISFAERIYHGGVIGIDYYDPNPPLSFLFYVPVIALQKISGIAVYHVHFFYTLTLCAFSFGLSLALLAKIPQIDRYTKHLLAIVYLCALIIVPANDFGDREHVIIMGLVPFMMAQICMSAKIHISPFIKYPALLFGCIGVLIKPHYGLLPTLILLHRFWKNRSFKIIFDADFLVLAIGVISYAAILFLFFPNFIHGILPDIFTFYTSQRSDIVYPETALFVLLSFVIWAACYSVIQNKQDLGLLSVLCLGTAFLLIPLFVQGKGLNTHRIPYMSVLGLSFATSLFWVLRAKLRQNYSVVIAIFVSIFMMWLVRGVPTNALTHYKFQNLPLSVALKNHCPKECTYLFIYDFSDIVHQIGLYHGAQHGSRFTSLWFLPVLQEGTSFFSEERYERLIKQYGVMIEDDQMRYNPDVIIHLKSDDFRALEFLRQFPKFDAHFKNYDLVEVLAFPRKIYYPGYIVDTDTESPANFEIYKRRSLH